MKEQTRVWMSQEILHDVANGMTIREISVKYSPTEHRVRQIVMSHISTMAKMCIREVL